MDYSERVKRIVEKDAVGAVRSIMNVVESDVVALMGDFMSIKNANFDVKSDGNGGYVINIKISVDRFFDIGKTTCNI